MLKSLRKDKAVGKITEDQFNELNRRLRPEFGARLTVPNIKIVWKTCHHSLLIWKLDADQKPDFVEAIKAYQAQLRVVEISVVVILLQTQGVLDLPSLLNQV